MLFLALSLLMVGVFAADHHNFAVPFDDLALVAHRFDRRSDFHSCVLLVFVAVNYSAFVEVIRAYGYPYAVAFANLDIVHTHLPAQIRGDHMPVG